MDLESECSALESVEDNEVIATNENLDNVSDSANKVENNGSCFVEHNNQFDGGVNGKAVEVTQDPVNSSPTVVGKGPATGSGSGSPSPVTVTKGYGLRKWRRIKREVIKDGVGNVDTGKLMKRGLSNAVPLSGKPMQFSAEMKQKSEGSVSSTNAIERGLAVVVDGFAMGDLGLVMGPVFAAGTDSENSEDQSSKSSTAASVPKTRYEGPVAMGHARDKYRMRSLSGKNLGSSVQRVQQGKVWTDTSKKPRGERVKIEKENSHSSMESDSRSSNFVFMQGTNSVTSNGRQNGRSLNCDGNNSDEAHGIERQLSEEAVYGIKNGDFEDVSQGDLAAGLSWGGKEETSENQECSTDPDPLVEPIQLLQSVQEALEREVQKFREIGKEEIPVDDSSQDSCLPSELISVGLGVQDPSSSEQSHPGDHVPRSLHSLESEIISLKENVHFLESKLDEVTAMLKVKEAMVVELEATLNSRSLEEETACGIESELEALFRQKIEGEVEYLAISRTIHDLRLLEDERKLVSEQSQMVNKLGVAESKSLKLKREAEKLAKYSEDVVSADEILKLQKNVWKYSSCLVIQLIMLAIIVGLFMLHLSPHSAGVVPT